MTAACTQNQGGGQIALVGETVHEGAVLLPEYGWFSLITVHWFLYFR